MATNARPPITLLVLAIAASIFGDTTAGTRSYQYLQEYPPVDEADGRIPLHFALVLSFGGEYVSIGALPGIQIALDYINNEPSILPGYSLHYTLVYSECNHTITFSSFHKQINFGPTKVGWIGSGCSIATELTAALTQYYNITQLSCVSSSAELRNRARYRYYFQMLATEVLIAQGFYGIIQNFGWKRIGIISQDENVFTQTVDILRQSLDRSGVEVIEKRFRSHDGIYSITQLFDPSIRIYLLTMYSPHARDFLCEAYHNGLVYPKYTFITYGWYVEDWLQESSYRNCTEDELASLIVNSLAPTIREIPIDGDLDGEPGITVGDFKLQYSKKVQADENKAINLESYTADSNEPFVYSYHCHEGMLSFAYALNKTIADLAEDEELNREAADQSDLPEGETFTMANFTYANSAVVTRMFEHINNTPFQGLSGNKVKFNADGTRDIDTVAILQYQRNSSGFFNRFEVATVNGTNGTFYLTSDLMLPYGIPYDGVPIEEVVTVSVALTVVYVILTTAGLGFVVVCILFTLKFRKKKLIRLSSPNLNYIIGFGAVVLYFNVITLVIPTTNPDFSGFLCNINPWLTSLGYSLCYGTILIKMVRVWLIFNKPLGLKATLLQDYAMALFVVCLVVIDIVILGVYTLTELVRGQLGVKLISNRENPEDTIGPTAEIHQNFLYVCESEGQVVLFAILFGYKGILTVFALLLAFRIRKVKIKGLDDSKYIAASIYVTSIVLTVVVVSTYTLRDFVNVYPAVVGIGFLLGTTAILGLVFVPRMVGLYKDPEGDKIVIGLSSSIDRGSQNEVVELRRRISELEKNLQQRPSFSGPLPDNLPSEYNGGGFTAFIDAQSRLTTDDQASSNGIHRKDDKKKQLMFASDNLTV